MNNKKKSSVMKKGPFGEGEVCVKTVGLEIKKTH